MLSKYKLKVGNERKRYSEEEIIDVIKSCKRVSISVQLILKVCLLPLEAKC